jgi:MFS family permease
MNSEVVSAALWRSIVANTNTNSLLFIVSAIIATLVSIRQIYGSINTFFAGCVLIVLGALVFGLNLYLYINWRRRNNSLPDLVVPFGTAFALCIIIATGVYSTLFPPTDQSKIAYTEYTFTENLTVAAIVLLAFVGFIDGSIRSDNVFMIAPYAAIAFTAASLIANASTGYLAALAAESSDEKQIKVAMYTLSFFFLFLISTVLMDKITHKLGLHTVPEREPATPKSIVQQKKLIVFGLFAITVLIACFLWSKTDAVQPRDFSAWLPPIVTLVAPIAMSALAVLITLFKYDAPELYETFAGLVLAFIILQVGLTRIQWSITTTGFIFIAASVLFVAAGMRTSLLSKHTLAIALFVFGITLGRIVSDENRLIMVAIDLLFVFLLNQLKIADENDTLLFLTSVFVQSVSPFFFQGGATWDQFGEVFSLFLARTLFLISLRTVLTFIGTNYVRISQKVFEGYTDISLTRKLVTVVYTVIASVLVDTMLRQYINTLNDDATLV